MDSESIAHGSRYISRSKPKIPFHGLFLLRNQTETLAQAIHDSIPFPLACSEVGLYNCTDMGLSVYNYFAVKIGKSNHQRMIEGAIVKGLQSNR